MKAILTASRNKGTKKIEKMPSPEASNPPPVNQGGGYSKSHKKVRAVKGSFPRNFPQFKVVN
jgi:hypothetical protein